jgi:hypothetical protein
MRQRTGNFSLSFFHLGGKLVKRLETRSFQIRSGVKRSFSNALLRNAVVDMQNRAERQLEVAMHK